MSKSETSRDQIDAMFAAVRAGKVRAVTTLLSEGVSPNVRDTKYFNETPLMAAARKGHEKVFLELIKAGANPHAADRLGSTVLQAASSAKGSRRMVEAVISTGIKPTDGLALALEFASADSNAEVVQTLIDAGADVNGKSSDGGTPLIGAVAWNRHDNVSVLLKAGARTDCRVPRDSLDGDKHYKKTALELAVAKGYVKIANLLRAAGAKVPSKPKRSAKPDTVTKSWNRIDQWIKRNAPKWKPLKKGASSAQILSAESKLGFKMSADLSDSYLVHAGSNNGAQIFPSPDNISHYLMPLSDVVDDWKMMKELLDLGDFEGLKGKSDRGIRSEWWNLRWIPFASNGGGDFFCIDMAPAAGGKKGQVITHNHESGNHKLLASSFREWLYILANGLEDETYSFDEDGGLV